MLAVCIMGSAIACSPEDESSPGENKTYTLQFKALVGESEFECGRTYEGLGSQKTSISFTDFRLYVHSFYLINERGDKRPLILEDDRLWQAKGVALLDFENGCVNGTEQQNGRVIGRAEFGSVSGIEFSIGVPKNINSPATMLEGRGSPLNQTSLFWSWRAGYKFVRLDSSLESFRFHLGSVGCSDEFECDHPNIATFRFDSFTPETQSIAIDLGALLATSNLEQNTEGTAQGCMGDPADPECVGIFEQLGLIGNQPSSAIRIISTSSNDQGQDR